MEGSGSLESKKPFGLLRTSARFQRKCFFPLSASLRKIRFILQSIATSIGQPVTSRKYWAMLQTIATFKRLFSKQRRHVRIADKPFQIILRRCAIWSIWAKVAGVK